MDKVLKRTGNNRLEEMNGQKHKAERWTSKSGGRRWG